MKTKDTISSIARTSLTLISISCILLIQACGGSKSAKESTAKEQEQTSTTPVNKEAAFTEIISTLSTAAISSLSTEAKANTAIPLPEAFKSLEAPLQKMGESDILKDLTASLNETVAGSLGDYSDVLKDTVSSLKIPAVDAIMEGGDDSITRYLQTSANDQLRNKLVPLISSSIEGTEAQAYLDKMEGLLSQNQGALSSLSSLAGIKYPTNFNATDFVSDEVMGRFFNLMAKEEKKLRDNPQGRSAELLEQLMAVSDSSK